MPDEATDEEPGDGAVRAPSRTIPLAAGILVGLAAGTFLSGAPLIAASALGYLFWSVVFGILVVAPMAGRYASDRFFSRLSSPTPEDRQLIRLSVARMAEASAHMLTEKQVTPEARVVRDLFDAVADRFTDRLLSSEDGMEGAAKQKISRAIGDVVNDEGREAFFDMVAERMALEPETRRRLPLAVRFLQGLGKRRPGAQQQQETYQEGGSWKV